MNWRKASVFGYILLLGAMLGLLFERSLLASGWFARIVQISASLLMIWARVTFGRRSFHLHADPTEGGLVTSGPYHYIRHPIYASILYFMWATALSHGAMVHVLLAILGSLGATLRILAEEKLVTEIYPEYREYASRTKRIVPMVL
jgi:protein-S-isoprenylcysteine O-methyltransferase Ste14